MLQNHFAGIEAFPLGALSGGFVGENGQGYEAKKN
jgi:hypothetical protein